MKRMIKNEWCRLLGRPSFWAALAVGCGISCWHFFQYVWGTDVLAYDNLPANLYISWIGANAYRMQSYWYFMVLPLLAALPFAWTFYEDMSGGYAASLLLRSSRGQYFKAKGMVLFLSGGISVDVPLALNLFLTATQCPALRPEPYVGTGPLTYCIGSRLYYLHPFCYELLYLALLFAAGGCMALGAAVLAYYFRFKVIGLLLPFLIYYALYCFSMVIDSNLYSPNYFLNPGMGMEDWKSLAMAGAGIAAAVLTYAWKGKKYEA